MYFKREIKYYIMLILSLFIVFVGNVRAEENRVMYLDCDDYIIAYIPVDADMNISDYLVFKSNRLGNYIYNGPSTKPDAKKIKWTKDNGKSFLNKEEIYEEIRNGNCPNSVDKKFFKKELIFSGTKKGNDIKKFNNANYIISKYKKDSNKYLISGYTKNAEYFSFIYNTKTHEVEDGDGYEYKDFLRNLKDNKSNFFNLENSYDYIKTSTQIGNDIDIWLNKNGGPYKIRRDAINDLNKMTSLNNACKKINNKEAMSETNLNNTSNLINDLTITLELLNTASAKTGKEFKKCSNPSEIVSDDVSFVDCAYNISIGNNTNASQKFLGLTKSLLYDYLKSKNLKEFDIDEKKKFYNQCYVNINENDEIKNDLSANDKRKLEDLKEGFESLFADKDVNVIVNCETLLSDGLKAKLKEYINAIKIAIPIIIIVFGIVDFAKAIFSDDDNEMKKAQKQFITRLAIAILIFFTPIFVDILLKIANEVWKNISPNSCGIF